MSRTLQEELVHFISDMFSVEQQALAQLVSAPEIAGDPALAEMFSQHHLETQRQADMVEARLEAHDGSPSALKNAVMKLGGKGFLLFARTLAETPGRLMVHSYSYEAMEWAGYQMLLRLARRAGDEQTVETARTIAGQEWEMKERLESGFDAAEAYSHRELSAEEVAHHVRKHLAEVHAFEEQAIPLLEKGEKMAGSAELSRLYHDHLLESRGHATLVEERLEALGSDRSLLQDAALALGALNWGMFFQAQSDTPAKLAAFAYAFEHLEIGGYEMLRRTARRGADVETERLCDTILSQERAMAERLKSAFDSAVEATLAEVS